MNRTAKIIVVIVVVALAGFLALRWLLPQNTDTLRRDVSEKVAKIKITNSAGRVQIRATSQDHVSVEAVQRWRGVNKPEVTVQVTGDTVEVSAGKTQWFTLFGSSPSVDFTITVPEGVSVDADSDAGDVAASGAFADTRLKSDAGQVTADGTFGQLWAHSSAGRVMVSGTKASGVDIESSAGEVSSTIASFGTLKARCSAGKVSVTARDFAAIDADSSAGRVDVFVPTGSYRIDASTSAGKTQLDRVMNDSGAGKSIRAHSSAGNVTITGS